MKKEINKYSLIAKLQYEMKDDTMPKYFRDKIKHDICKIKDEIYKEELAISNIKLKP